MSAISHLRIDHESDEGQGVMRAMRLLLRSWDLTKMEARLLGALIDGELVSGSRLAELLYQDEADVRRASLDVLLLKLRRKIGPFGLRIRNRYRQGYVLESGGASAAATLACPPSEPEALRSPSS